mmetsp:Transcript_50069/g.106565  ORF Transcript_50069/g.106565 Transcript_50069/m.106565 type:complete len:132 (-) Transcript_50069:323-718(-)
MGRPANFLFSYPKVSMHGQIGSGLSGLICGCRGANVNWTIPASIPSDNYRNNRESKSTIGDVEFTRGLSGVVICGNGDVSNMNLNIASKYYYQGYQQLVVSQEVYVTYTTGKQMANPPTRISADTISAEFA